MLRDRYEFLTGSYEDGEKFEATPAGKYFGRISEIIWSEHKTGCYPIIKFIIEARDCSNDKQLQIFREELKRKESVGEIDLSDLKSKVSTLEKKIAALPKYRVIKAHYMKPDNKSSLFFLNNDLELLNKERVNPQTSEFWDDLEAALNNTIGDKIELEVKIEKSGDKEYTRVEFIRLLVKGKGGQIQEEIPKEAVVTNSDNSDIPF